MKHFLIALTLTAFATSAHSEIEIQQITTESGLTVWLVEEHSIPIVSIDMLFRGGSSLDPEDKHGATFLMMGLLEEGAGDLDATGFLEESERLAANFDFDSGRDMVSVSATMLKENLEPSLDLLHLAIVEPNFDQIAFDRVQGQVYSIIRSDLSDPQSIAADRFNQIAFPDHPYARNQEGTLESVAALTPDDMRNTHKYALVRSRLVISVVGDITAEELVPLLDKLLSGLPETGPELPTKIEMQATGGVEVIDFPSPQSVAIFGHSGIARDDPDFLIAYVMNRILGSGSSSRLNQEVREKRGLTYGVSSYLVARQQSTIYMGSLASANDKMAEAMQVVKDEWQRLAEGGVSAEELEAAQRYLTGSYPLRFDSNGAIASILASLQFANLPADYILTRNDQVNAITVEDIVRVAKRLLKPENLRVIVVGQPENIVNE